MFRTSDRKAIVAKAVGAGITVPKAVGFQAFAGRGASAKVLDNEVKLALRGSCWS
jgi:hypothetical protein